MYNSSSLVTFFFQMKGFRDIEPLEDDPIIPPFFLEGGESLVFNTHQSSILDTVKSRYKPRFSRWHAWVYKLRPHFWDLQVMLGIDKVLELMIIEIPFYSRVLHGASCS